MFSFKIGRSTESMIDFVVTDMASSNGQCQGQSQGGAGGDGGQSAQSTISRYACRIMCERSAPYTARIYAAGFDSSKNIFLGVSHSSSHWDRKQEPLPQLDLSAITMTDGLASTFCKLFKFWTDPKLLSQTRQCLKESQILSLFSLQVSFGNY